MTDDTGTTIAPIALGRDDGEALWAFGGVALIKASGEDTGGRVMVSEQRAPRGVGSPLHVHHREDERFYVLDGEVTFWVAGEVVVADAGTFVYGPRDIAHTFLVTSDDARFLLVTEPGGFTDFVRAAGRPGAVARVPAAARRAARRRGARAAGGELRHRHHRTARDPGLRLTRRRGRACGPSARAACRPLAFRLSPRRPRPRSGR